MRKLFSALQMNIFLLLALSVIAGCNTGGLSDPPASGTTPSPTPTPTAATIISGTVVDGFISGATVRAYQISPNGTKGNPVGSAATSDSSGNYTLNLGTYTGPVLIESSGGSFTDWATGNPVTLLATDILTAVVSDANGSITVQVTPLTHMAAQRALRDMQINGTAAATAVDSANTKISQYFGGFNILTDKPIDPNTAGSASGVSQARVDYALALAGIAKNAATNGLQPFSLITALANDASDGLFDGKQGTTPIKVTTAAGGSVNLPASAGKADMSTNIQTFQNSAQNRSGGTTTPFILTSFTSTTGSFFTKPDPPSQLTATVLSSSQINLSWTAVAGAASYNIYRDDALLKSVKTTTTADTGLVANTEYDYAVSATDISGNESNKSSQVSATTNDPPPASPTGLMVRATSPTRVDLSWTTSAGASQYKIYRNGVVLSGAVVLAPVTTYSDTSVAANTQYSYAIVAIDATGSESGPTSPSLANTGLTVPSGLTATVNSSTQITLSWTNSGGALVSGYRIYKNGIPLPGGDVTSLSLADGGLMAKTQYCYTVSATSTAGNESAQSGLVCGTTNGPPPAVPAGVTVRATSPTKIDLSWTASAGASQYKIYRNGLLLPGAVVLAPVTTYSDTSVAANTQYSYAIVAIDATGSESGPTSPSPANTGLTVPSGLTATVNSSTQITLSWTNSGGALVSGYNVYKSGSVSVLRSVTTTTTSDTGLSANTQFCYSVSATDGSGNESAQSGLVCGTTQPSPVPASIDLLVSSPQLNSDDAAKVTLTALVRDNGNRAMSGQTVIFSTSSTSTGSIVVTQGTTDASGTATATLGTGGNSANRAIDLAATTGAISATNTVNVIGTTISVSGLNSLSLGAATNLTVFLNNSAGTGIAGKTITLTSQRGNTLSAASSVTNTSGQIAVTVTAAVSGDDVITASASGATKTFLLNVNPSVLTMTAPASGMEVPIGTNQPVTVAYINAGLPVSGLTVNFMTTRGLLSSATGVTAANGSATVNVSSTTTGPALLSAFVTGGAAAQTAIEFVATTPAKMKLQANPVLIGTNSGTATTEKSLITAVVRDANNNLVKNKKVNFTLTTDVSGGTLSPASAVTDSSGTANTYYIAGPASTGTDGVRISAAVEGSPAVTATAQLTVSQKALFVALATGPKIFDLPDGLRYQKDYVALVTNATGKPIQGAKVTATVTPQFYRKGFYVVSGATWQRVPTLIAASSTRPDVPACANEDGILHNPLFDFNGVLDPGEDQNNNNRLDPGNIASVTASDTDSSGFSTISITYAKNYAYWVNVRLMVQADTEGDTTSAGVDFDLTGAAVDFTDVTVSPPGSVSPFGVSTSCFDTRPDAPTGITAAAASSTLINLSWTASSGATGYKIFRNGVPVNTVSTVTAKDTGLASATQYCYTLSAYDATGSESAPSAQVCVTTPSLAPPTSPTVAAVSSSQINFSWTASAGAAGYRVYKGGTFWQSVAASTVSILDTGLTANAQYCYKVSAYDAAGIESAQTVQLCATTPTLAAVTNLTVTAASSSQIDLSWTAAAGASNYRIYRSAGGVAATPLKYVSQTSASDTGLAANSYYCYTVSVLDGANNESAQSSQLCTATYGLPPAVPAGLTVRTTLPTQIDLSWTGSPGASQYKIYRDGQLLTATTGTTYADAAVIANTRYAYTVTAIDATGSESNPTGQTVAHTGLTVPSGVTATVNSSTQITLSWINSGGALVTGYKVYKGELLMGAVAPKTATAIVDGGLTANTQYCYSVSATSDSGGESARSMTVCGTTQPPPMPASLDLLVSSPQLNSDGLSMVTLTAVVKDAGNRALSGQAVSFTADSGLLTVTSGTTGANGTATATLGTGGDKTNRTINLTAATAGIDAVNTVTVTGTTLSISGSSSLSFGDFTPLTIFLKDSAGIGIAGKTVSVTSTKGNTLSAGPYVTDAIGQVIVNVTAAVSGTDTIKAIAIGATKEFDLTVNASILTFTSPAPPPAAVTEIAIDALPLQAVSVKYTSGGAAQAGVTVTFVTTRGTLSAASAVTNASGIATVYASATNSGPVLFLASIAGGPSAQAAAEFVATTVNSVTMQAAPNTIGTNSGGLTTEKSLITAVVRDAKGNLVKNKTVNFNMVYDASGGSLFPPSSITDGSGTASTYFIAGGAPSPLNGVIVRGSVAGTTVSKDLFPGLTVAKKALFITLATGPKIEPMSDGIRYQKNYVALVTDAAGDPVAGATVVATVTPVYYQKGYYILPVGVSRWQQVVTLQAASTTLPGIPACANEDGMLNNSLYDFNGVLDTDPLSGAKEDQNGNSRLDPGNVASVTATVTDAAGHSTISIVYAKDYAYWVNVQLEAFASTAGSTASAIVSFDLPGYVDDYSSSVVPPGNPSPFGISTTCFVDLTVTPISSTQMSIVWQQSATADHYHVYRDGINIGNAAKNTYSDTGLTGGTSYCYQIRTVNALGLETVFTGTICAATNAAATVPTAAPTGLTVTALSPTQIRVSWDNVGLAGYHIYRADSAVMPLQSVVSTSITDAGLTANTLYCYTVSGYSAAGVESAQSSQVCTTTQAGTPPTPTGLTATGGMLVGPPITYQVTLNWTASVGAAVYRVYRDGAVEPVLSATGVTATDTTTGMKGQTGYCYSISAVNVSGNESAQSTQVCTATP